MKSSDDDVALLSQWLASALGSRSVRFAGFLHGSTTATLLSFDAVGAHGATLPVVVKVYDRPLPHVHRTDVVRQEAAGLRLAETASLPAPRLVALDAGGSEVGAPAVAMTRLIGRPEIGPGETWWIAGLAQTLRRIVAADVGKELANLPHLSRWRELDPARPDWVDDGLWRAAVEAARDLPMSPNTLLHRDFHPLNVIWSNREVTGVVDWLDVCQGPVEFDISRCRVNVALANGAEAADCFLQECGHIASKYIPAWDLETLLGFADHPDVLLTLNAHGASLTPASIRASLLTMIRNAV